MKRKLLILKRMVVVAMCAGALLACERRERARREKSGFDDSTRESILATWQTVSKNWPASSQRAARELAQKYGPPDEIGSSQLIWTHGGPWKKNIVWREEVPHDWPSPHMDVLEQVIDYRVPPDKMDELAKFDGSVMVDRTKGELSARCADEPANFLAVNIARDLVDEKLSVAGARSSYESAMKKFNAGDKPDFMNDLKFRPFGGTGDPDHAVAAK